MIFDVKIDFTWKACYVAGGRVKEPPAEATYSSVVSRECFWIAFLIAALIDLQICVADVTNTYIREEMWTITGTKFRATEQGSMMIVKKTLHGLKSSCAAWRALFASTLADQGYVDDIIVVSQDQKYTMDAIADLYRLKEGCVGEPTTYLRANVTK